jgi:predicted ATPase
VEVEQVYSRALELCRQVGESAQLFPVLGGLWQIYMVRAKFSKARKLAEQLLTLAQGVQDSTLLLVAHDALGQICFYLGEFTRARTYFEYSLALYDPQHHHRLAFLVGGEDPGVACRGYTALTLWVLGYPAQARQCMHEALTLARELSSSYDLAWALHTGNQFHHLQREGSAVQERAEALLALSSEQGFAYWSATATILRGWALAEQGHGEEGIRQICQGLEAYRATGAVGGRPYFLALLAEAYGKVGQFEEGLKALAEALATGNRTGERYYDAELYRLNGELMLAQARTAVSKHG